MSAPRDNYPDPDAMYEERFEIPDEPNDCEFEEPIEWEDPLEADE